MVSGPITSWHIDGEKWKQWQTIFLGSQITADGDCSHEIKRCSTLEEKLWHLDSLLRSRDITLPTKVRLVKAMVFSSSHVWMWKLDYKESWVLKNWCLCTVVLEKTLESPLDSKEIQPVHPKGNQSWIFIGRTDAEAETLILWAPDEKNWLIWKDPDAGKDWRQEEKGTTGWDSCITSPTQWASVQFSSAAQSCLTLCDPMNRSTPGLPVHHQLPESMQTHVHWVGGALQPSHPFSSPSPPALNLSQHQGLFQWVSSSNQVAKVLEFQLQHQSFQWTPRTDFL